MQVLRKRGLFSKKPLSTQGHVTLAQNRRQNPLDIPEILELILTYLSQHALGKAQQVSRQWMLAGQMFVQRNLDWNPLSTPKERERVLCSLWMATGLTCHHNNYDTSRANGFGATDYWRLWKALRDRNDAYQQNLDADEEGKKGRSALSLPLRELVMMQHTLSFDDDLAGVLLSVPYLTRLSLSSRGYCSPQKWLDAVFGTCLGLMSFELISTQKPMIIDDQGLNSPEDPHPPQQVLPPLKLRLLTLERVAIHQQELERRLEAMPHLNELRLVSLYRIVTELDIGRTRTIFTANFDTTLFVQFVRTLSYHLQAFHFSMADEKLSDGAVQEILTEYYPSVRTLGLFAGDLDSSLVRSLVHIPNRLTTLEISAWVGPHRQALGLHEYLCEAPLLLHLKAGKVPFNICLMDLNHIIPIHPHSNNADPSSSTSSTMMDSSEGSIPNVWACSRLQTLNLLFMIPGQSWDLKDHQFRIICGYIIRFCPKLQEFATESTSQVDLHLQSGFCLLARLEHLERLCIVSTMRWKTPYEDLDWMTSQQSLWQRIRRRRTMAKFLTESLPPTPSPTTETVRAGMWKDRKHIGRLSDVKMVLEEINEGLVDKCWPRLECLEVWVYDGSPLRMMMVQKLKRVRPKEFRLRVVVRGFYYCERPQ